MTRLPAHHLALSVLKKSLPLLWLASIPALAATSFESAKKSLTAQLIQAKYDDENPDAKKVGNVLSKFHRLYDEKNLNGDRNKTRNEWKTLFPIRSRVVHAIEGKRIYYGLFPKNYRYDVIEDPQSNRLIVSLRIHFYVSEKYNRIRQRLIDAKDPSARYYKPESEVLSRIESKVKEAQEIWNKQAPKRVSFDFQVVNSKENAHYSVKLVDRDIALYDKVMSVDAGDETIPHEIGHMLGLDEEYSFYRERMDGIKGFLRNGWVARTVFKVNPAEKFEEGDVYSTNPEVRKRAERVLTHEMRCDLDSIMCYRTKIYPYHFNHVLGRIPLQ